MYRDNSLSDYVMSAFGFSLALLILVLVALLVWAAFVTGECHTVEGRPECVVCHNGPWDTLECPKYVLAPTSEAR